MMKGQKGITLVALVITIIVMLILVGVTISVAMQGGLFEKAQDAADRTNNAQQSEQNLAADGIVNIDGNMVSIDNYVPATTTPATTPEP